MDIQYSVLDGRGGMVECMVNLKFQEYVRATPPPSQTGSPGVVNNPQMGGATGGEVGPFPLEGNEEYYKKNLILPMPSKEEMESKRRNSGGSSGKFGYQKPTTAGDWSGENPTPSRYYPNGNTSGGGRYDF